MSTKLVLRGSQPMCPHCGHIERDAWEIDFGPALDGDTTISCARCGKDFFCSRCVTVKYASSKLTTNIEVKAAAEGSPATERSEP